MNLSPRVTNIVVALATAMFLFACNKTVESPTINLGGQTMGTTWVATLTPPESSSLAMEDWLSLIQAALNEVDGAMSTYKPDSDLNRFSAAEPNTPVPLSPHTRAVLHAAREVNRLSNGAFDPTVGALLQLWGFGAKRSAGVEAQVLDEPTADSIAALLQSVGLVKVLSGDDDASIFAQDPSRLFLDFSAIAKGYGADQVAAVLLAEGVQDFLVEVGGEVVVRGERPGGGPWRLAIESPLPERPDLTARVHLTDRALATSGNYRNFRELAGGKIISHTIDPRTGRPVEDPPASVSVIAHHCMLADAWATALSVLGPDGLQAIEDQPQLEARMLFLGHGGAPERILTTSGWNVATRPPESVQ
jgi:thiamine biosynthesis lipoprotein